MSGFNLTNYEARRRQDPKRKEYMKEIYKTPEYKQGKREYHRSSAYKEKDRNRRESPNRIEWKKEYEIKKRNPMMWSSEERESRCGVNTLENFI